MPIQRRDSQSMPRARTLDWALAQQHGQNVAAQFDNGSEHLIVRLAVSTDRRCQRRREFLLAGKSPSDLGNCRLRP